MNVWEVGPLQENQENRFAQKSKTNKSQQEKLDPGGGGCCCFIFSGGGEKTEQKKPYIFKAEETLEIRGIFGGGGGGGGALHSLQRH